MLCRSQKKETHALHLNESTLRVSVSQYLFLFLLTVFLFVSFVRSLASPRIALADEAQNTAKQTGTGRSIDLEIENADGNR